MADALTEEPTSPAPSWGGKTLKLLVRVAITAAVLGLIVREVDVGELLTVLRGANLWLIALAVSFTLALNLVKPVRWLILVRAAVPATRYPTALKSLLVAAAGRIVLPSKIGEFARIFMIPGLRVSSGIGLTLIDILVEAQVALLWATPGLYVLGGMPAVVAGIVGVVVIAVLTRAPHRCIHPIAKLIGNDKLDAKVLSARDMMRRLGTRGWLKAIAVTLVISIFRFSQLFVLLWAVGANVSLGTLAYIPLIQLSDAVPLTVGGVGIREWVGLQILPQVGVTPSMAVSAVLLQSLITNILPGVVGLTFVRGAEEDVLARLRKRAAADSAPIR
ncbi:MAG: lysylphosphatidylglycerol synthase transmembrane domain-containing protein [Myxococcota bacterium]